MNKQIYVVGAGVGTAVGDTLGPEDGRSSTKSLPVESTSGETVTVMTLGSPPSLSGGLVANAAAT